MPLTPQEAFKVGFLERCVQDGLSPDQMLSRVKQARDMLEKRALFGLVDRGLDAAGGLAKGLASYGTVAALAAPPILGGLGGYALAKGTDIDDTDVNDIKNRELIDEYQRQAAELKRRKSVRSYKQERGQSGRVFM